MKTHMVQLGQPILSHGQEGTFRSTNGLDLTKLNKSMVLILLLTFDVHYLKFVSLLDLFDLNNILSKGRC